MICGQLHALKTHFQYWGICEWVQSSVGGCTIGWAWSGCVSWKVSFLNHLCWCEKQVSSVKANSWYILGRKGGKYVVCLEFGFSCFLWQLSAVPVLEGLYLFSPHFLNLVCWVFGVFLGFLWVFFFTYILLLLRKRSSLSAACSRRASVLKNADNRNTGNATSETSVWICQTWFSYFAFFSTLFFFF